MIKVGLTGEMASGKTFISILFENKGVPIYNCDERSKFLITSNSELNNKIISHFGNEIVEGNIFKNLSNIVFNDETQLETLTTIVYPYLFADLNQFYIDNQSAKFCIVESAILYESRLINEVDKVIYVYVPKDIRLERAKQRSNISSGEYDKRMSKQIDPIYKIQKSNYIISNYSDFDINKLAEQIYEHLYLTI